LAVHSFVHIIGITLLAATLFSLAGLLNAIYAKSFDDVNIIPTFVLTPLTYLGGVFYSISLLPPVWQTISKLNPIIYMVNAFRYGFLGVTDVALPLAYGMIALFIGVFYAIIWWLIETGRGLRH
jgi:ABC-2 type transport system permease protein